MGAASQQSGTAGVGALSHWGRLRRIGVGYYPAPMGVNLPQWVVSCPNAVRREPEAARGPFSRRYRAAPARISPAPARYGLFLQRCRQDGGRFHSDTTLCKRYNALGFSQEVQRAVCVGFLRGFPAEAFAWSLVELIVHLLDPRGADAVQWGPLGEVLAQQAVGVLIGAALPGAAGLAEVDGGAQ